MSRRELGRTIQGITSFEDLKGLRAEGYIRDSTLDQRDGFGPEIQRHNIERFSNSYGLELGRRWYTEFVSGRNTQHRSQFRHSAPTRPIVRSGGESGPRPRRGTSAIGLQERETPRPEGRVQGT